MKLTQIALPLLLVGSLGCGKTRNEPPPPIVWHTLAEGEPIARKKHELALIHFGADWSKADLEVERETIPSAEVREELRDWIVIKVDITDDEEREVQKAKERFKIIGDPVTLAIDFEHERELFRFNEYMKPPVLAQALRDAKAKRIPEAPR